MRSWKQEAEMSLLRCVVGLSLRWGEKLGHPDGAPSGAKVGLC